MNRFFSKLDLRDIRIDPRSSRFGPDDGDDGAEAAAPHGAATPDQQSVPSAGAPAASRAPYVPSWRPTDDAAPLPASGAPVAHPAYHLDGDDAGTHGEVGDGDDVLKVSARSRPSAVAGAIAGVVRESGRAEVQAIGAGATNQAVKAVAIARDYLQETGIEVICLPAFIDVTIGDEDRTAIRLVIEPR